ncbi:3-hydroxyacyl-[acyl-carrier-protein] dehydratase [Chitinophaga niastensis]|uniref:3-hydroxyacyl-[acyl-carrier-protein] dehydratase n=1 Tax=Chitinophaga niastensis TaxID=536980 RepID=A0A2P8HN14_CHINA|nr:3-hydroxyacyl-ACP dehydratase [Chitinophaga niastensis]PSL47613.1 3-hydroxyacyl-[acyl-carrier-protein] dehydratase [Chitinophaga niastensis]
MLAGNFYNITQQAQEPGQVTATIELNAAHPIFQGHFPEQQVVPGVCMMQTITEILESAVQKKMLLQKASIMKFLNMIDPVKQPLVDVTVTYKEEEAGLKVTAMLKREDKTFMKFQGIFK